MSLVEKLGPDDDLYLSRRSKCSIGRLLTQNPDLVDEINACLDSRHGGDRIARVFRDEGLITVSGQTVNRHRRGDCQCPPRN